jgi:hypothetical protein
VPEVTVIVEVPAGVPVGPPPTGPPVGVLPPPPASASRHLSGNATYRDLAAGSTPSSPLSRDSRDGAKRSSPATLDRFR